MKKLMKTQTGRFLAGLIALLIVIGVVAGVGKLPVMKADVTPQQVMSMSETSLEIARGIDRDVTISYLSDDGSKELWVEELAMKYAQANSRISYEMIDPSSSKASELALLSGETLSQNALVVSCGDRAMAISQDEVYSVVYDEMALYYYGEYVAKEQYFVADEQLANALLYVTREDLPVIYALTGHGEAAPGSFLINRLQAGNVILKTLHLTDAVPADADAVMILAPTADLNQDELKAMLAYLKEGGNLLLSTGYMMEKLPNLNALTSYYGMEQACGVIIDPASGYSYSAEYTQYLSPDVAEHDTTALLTEYGIRPIIPLAGAVQRSSIGRAGLTVTELLTTSDQAYMKTSNDVTTLEMEEGDPVGPFTVAMAAEDGEAQVVWFSSGSFFTDSVVQISSGYNLYLLDGVLAEMTPLTEGVQIESANLMAGALSVPSEQTTMIIILMFVPALLALIIGFVMKKRK